MPVPSGSLAHAVGSASTTVDGHEVVMADGQIPQESARAQADTSALDGDRAGSGSGRTVCTGACTGDMQEWREVLDDLNANNELVRHTLDTATKLLKKNEVLADRLSSRLQKAEQLRSASATGGALRPTPSDNVQPATSTSTLSAEQLRPASVSGGALRPTPSDNAQPATSTSTLSAEQLRPASVSGGALRPTPSDNAQPATFTSTLSIGGASRATSASGARRSGADASAAPKVLASLQKETEPTISGSKMHVASTAPDIRPSSVKIGTAATETTNAGDSAGMSAGTSARSGGLTKGKSGATAKTDVTNASRSRGGTDHGDQTSALPAGPRQGGSNAHEPFFCHKHKGGKCEGPSFQCTYLRPSGKRCGFRFCLSGLREIGIEPVILLGVGLRDVSIKRGDHTPLARWYYFQCPRCQETCLCEGCLEAITASKRTFKAVQAQAADLADLGSDKAHLSEGADTQILTWPLGGGPGATTLFRSDLVKLERKELLSDAFIEFGLKYILDQKREGGDAGTRLADATHIYRSSLFEQLRQGYEEGNNWTEEVDIFNKDYLIMPIKKNRSQWCLAVIVHPRLILKRKAHQKSSKNIDDGRGPKAADPSIGKRKRGMQGDEMHNAEEPGTKRSRPALLGRLSEMEQVDDPAEGQSATKENGGWAYDPDVPTIIVFDSVAASYWAGGVMLTSYLKFEAMDKKREELADLGLRWLKTNSGSIKNVREELVDCKVVNAVIPEHMGSGDCGLHLLHNVRRFFSDPAYFEKTIVDQAKRGVFCLHKKFNQDWDACSAPKERHSWQDTISRCSSAWEKETQEKNRRSKDTTAKSDGGHTASAPSTSRYSVWHSAESSTSNVEASLFTRTLRSRTSSKVVGPK
ncbi:hypothetical protein CF319_g4278 [Tilletia indica]|nr:hypothetical protein CF319_g4278 [Tilletia indica]